MRIGGKKEVGPKAAAVIVDGIRANAVKRAAALGADLLEIRVDTFPDRDPGALLSDFKKLKLYCDLPILLTVRSKSEGGRFSVPDKKRLEIFNTLIPFADIVDIELSSSGILKSVVNLAKSRRKRVIISCHDFNSTPADKKLKSIIELSRAAGADIVKIAALIKGPGDLRRLAGVLTGYEDLIIIGMGPKGAASRIFFPMIGSCFTYGSITGSTAPGQMALKEIKKEFSRYGL